MVEKIDDEVVETFLSRVIEIESKPPITKGNQKTARQEKIKSILDQFFK